MQVLLGNNDINSGKQVWAGFMNTVGELGLESWMEFREKVTWRRGTRCM